MSNSVSLNNTFNKVVIPLLRRTLPNIIANDIIGVSPMAAPAGQIFSLRTRYGQVQPHRIKISNAQYNKFVRLNNRKRTQTIMDIKNAGYFSIYFIHKTFSEHIDCIEWCDKAYGKDGYIISENEFFFENEEDITLFKLTWIYND